MQIDEIIRRVRAEAGKTSPDSARPSRDAAAGQPGQGPELKDRYHVRELLAVDDRDLVDAVYRCLLRREPDPSSLHYRQNLAAGAMEPVEIIGRIRFSAEGRQKKVPVQGLVPRLAFAMLKKIPLLGYLLDLLVILLRLPALKRDIADLRADARSLHATKADHGEVAGKADRVELEQKADRRELAGKADRAELEQKAERREMLACRDAVRHGNLYIHGLNAELQKLLDELNGKLSAEDAPGRMAHERLAPLAAEMYDKLYLDFEALYRGTREEVGSSLTVYAELLKSLAATPGLPRRAIDLGSGRGEMLGFLGQLGFDAAGIDMNRVAVASCQEEGLHASCADALASLDSLAQDSVALVTSLHMVEHLAPRDLFRLLQAALRVLAPGGILLLETPNPRNLLVGAGDFYRDFTHTKPLFPDTLSFLLDYFGYADAEAFFFEDAGNGVRRLVPAREVRFAELDDYLGVSRDYAVVGYKRCG